MNRIIHIGTFLLTGLILLSCAGTGDLAFKLEKRRYRSGFNSTFLTSAKKEKNNAEENLQINKKKEQKNTELELQNALASASSEKMFFLEPLKDSTEIKVDTISNNKNSCDTITLFSGKRIAGKVMEIGISEIKYKRCDNLEGPVISILKEDAAHILYSNGSEERFERKPTSNNSSNKEEPTDKKRVHTGGFIGFLLGVTILPVWLLVNVLLSFFMGLAGITLGLINLIKFYKNKDRYKKSSRNYAIASIFLGIIGIALFVLALMLFV